MPTTGVLVGVGNVVGRGVAVAVGLEVGIRVAVALGLGLATLVADGLKPLCRIMGIKTGCSSSLFAVIANDGVAK